MAYEIRIIRREPNPEFDNEIAQYEKDHRMDYGRMNHDPRMDPAYPKRELVKDALVTELTPEEYKRVKAEIIKIFE